MLYSINMQIINNNVDLDIESLDLEINLDAGGGIEGIKVDDREPTDIEIQIINNNLVEIQEEVGFRWMEDQKYKDHPAYMEM